MPDEGLNKAETTSYVDINVLSKILIYLFYLTNQQIKEATKQFVPLASNSKTQECF